MRPFFIVTVNDAGPAPTVPLATIREKLSISVA
jgi:hypothetical protein